VDAVNEAIKKLRARAKDPRLFLISGLADDLLLIASALDQLDNRLQTLEIPHGKAKE
jgi:hypothetical protein